MMSCNWWLKNFFRYLGTSAMFQLVELHHTLHFEAEGIRPNSLRCRTFCSLTKNFPKTS